MVNAIEFSETEIQNEQIEEAHLETILKDFHRDGYVVLKNVFSKEYINQLYTNFVGRYTYRFLDDNLVDKVAVGHKRFQVSVEVDDVFNSPQLYANPFIFPVMERLFSYESIISDLTCVTSMPGAKKMGIHADGRIFERHPIANLLPPHAVGALIPLIPFNQLNGPTRIWPGSQRMGPGFDNVKDKSNFIDIEIDTGSSMLMDHRIYHSGNPNLSDQLRPLLYINYSAIWYYDPHNFKRQAPLIINETNFEKVPDQYKGLFVRRYINTLVDPVPTVTNS